jgi:hypothetical protein
MLDEFALRKILQDPNSTPEERLTAQRQLDALHPTSPLTKAEERAIDLCGPLGLNLLRFAGTHELSKTTWRDLVRFADADDRPNKWENHDVEQLWRGWVLFVGYEDSPIFKDQIWDAIKTDFATEQERRAEFERLDGGYPLFGLTAGDNPYELEGYERCLAYSDRNLILAIALNRLTEAPEYAFRTREVAQRIIEKLTERK